MRFLRSTTIIAAFLIIAISIPPSLCSQMAQRPSQPKQPAPRRGQPRRANRADALAAAINELLKLSPLAPESPEDHSSGSSQDEEKPPADDAPIKNLVEYWSGIRSVGMSASDDAPKPSEKVRQRLLEAVEDRPWLANSLFNFLPETPDTHDRLYKLIDQEPDDEEGWKWQVRQWLTHNSGYFRDDLLADVRSTTPGDWTVKALKSLSKLDWGAARPFIESYAAAHGAPLASTALSLLYEHEMKSGDTAKVESYRAGLKAIVANRQAPADARGASLNTLMATEWSGRDEWFASLFADPSLSGLREAKGSEPNGKEEATDVETKLENLIRIGPNEVHSMPHANLLLVSAPTRGELIPVVSSLIGNGSRTAHNAAVIWLVDVMRKNGDQKLRQEVARTLLPWLTDPGWADEGDRASFISGYADLKLTESVAGLIWILDFDESADNRAAAATALAEFRDPGAIPSLRRALDREENKDRRADIVRALAVCGGFSDDEMAAAIEAYAKASPAEEGERESDNDLVSDEEKPLPLKAGIGLVLSEYETIQFSEGLIVKLIERAKALRTTQPAVARKILNAIEGISLPAAEINLVERIGEGWANVDTILLALESRDDLRKSAGDELYGLIKQGGYAAGVASAILNDEREWKATLESGDAKAQLALLACARYLSYKLPVELAGMLLASPNRSLAKATESYLEVEDSAAARKLILARHPGEAYILGSGTSFAKYLDNPVGMKQWEEEMRREVKSQNGAEEIYALGVALGPKTFTGVVIRVRGDKAEINVYDDPLWMRSYRQLTPYELEELRNFTARQEVEDLGPENGDWKYPAARSLNIEYLRLNRDGGRRIRALAARRAPKNPTLHEELAGLFHKLSNSGEFKVRYALEDKIPGLEVVWADKKQPILSVCQEKGELRVLTGDVGAYLSKGGTAQALPEPFRFVIEMAQPGWFKDEGALAPPEWRIFTRDGLGDLTQVTPACRRPISLTVPIKNRTMFQTIVSFLPNIHISYSESEKIYAVPQGKDQGVWKAEPGRDPVKLLDDAYESVFAMPDGKWLIGRKVVNEGGKGGTQLVRYNLRTNEVFPISFPRGGDYRALGFSEAHGKAIVVDGAATSTQPNGYLLDIETGSTQAVKGDFRPIAENEIRNLQPAGKPDVFWAAIFDYQKRATIVGRYDAKAFAFTPLIQLPELQLDSANIWVDQTGGWLWLAYRGHLMRLPLAK
jgi:HEAT repeats